jgi:hypothetical protein
MLKKVMIICLALSFVFIGGIAFAGNGHGPGDGTGEYGPGDCSFTSSDSSIIIAKRANCPIECDRCEHRRPNCPRQDFTSSDSSIIIARHGNDKGRGDQDRSRDGSCLDS